MYQPNKSSDSVYTMEEYSTYYNGTKNTTVTVELYSVFVNYVCLLLLAVPGVILNLGVLLSTRCKKGIRTLQYGLHYTLSVIHILFCIVWTPLHATQLHVNYQGTAMSKYLCYLSTGLFHFCLGSIVFLAVVMGVLNLHYLSSSPIPAIRSLVKRGIIASLFTASLLTILITVERPYNASFDVCTTATAKQEKTYKFWYSLLGTLLAVPYSVMLLVMMVLLWLAVQALRQRIREMVQQQGGNCHRQLDSLQENPGSTYEYSREEPSKHSSVTFKEPDIAETIPNKNGISKTSNNVPHKGIKFQEVVTSTDGSESEEDAEDEFDLKMRMKLQKSSSGRRHTVANIGLGDALFGSKRRGSLDVQRSPSTEKRYNYVRKWSVDITALQNQLENPKVHTGSYPFRELGILPEKEASTQEEHDEEDEESQEKSESVVQASTMSQETSEVREPSSANELPSIVIDEGLEDSGWQTSNDGNQANDESHQIDEEIVRRFHKQLKKTKKLIVFYMLSLLSFSPCLSVLAIQAMLTSQLALNLLYVTSPFCLLSSIFQPVVLVWMDTRLKQAVYRLWNKMTHWRCVCYCNIGSGKNFFGHPIDMEDKFSEDT